MSASGILSDTKGRSKPTIRGRALALAVLDDEADDASILDARDGHRITPQFIQRLWSSEDGSPATRHSQLYAAYIAYTATPQANYLQRSHNPLAPRSFHAALRVPSDRGALTPRTVTYTERKGLESYYCGGEVYYERLRGLPGDFCVDFPFPIQGDGEGLDSAIARHAAIRWQMIGDAIRSYLVAGAARLYLSGCRLSNVPSVPVSLDALRKALPATHSMLYHPSALKEAHFAGAEDIARWSRAIPGRESEVVLPIDESGEPLLSVDETGLLRRLDFEEDRWEKWLSYSSSTSFFAHSP